MTPKENSKSGFHPIPDSSLSPGGTCSHYSVNAIKGYYKLIDETVSECWRCVQCGARFAPVESITELVKIRESKVAELCAQKVMAALESSSLTRQIRAALSRERELDNVNANVQPQRGEIPD